MNVSGTSDHSAHSSTASRPAAPAAARRLSRPGRPNRRAERGAVVDMRRADRDRLGRARHGLARRPSEIGEGRSPACRPGIAVEGAIDTSPRDRGFTTASRAPIDYRHRADSSRLRARSGGRRAGDDPRAPARVAGSVSGPGPQRGLSAVELLSVVAVELAGRHQGGVPGPGEHRLAAMTRWCEARASSSACPRSCR